MPKTNTSVLETQPNYICEPVAAELGEQWAVELFDEFPDTFQEVAQQQELSQVQRPEDLETGVAANRARITLGCGTCILKQECTVNMLLTDKAEEGASNEVLASKLDMLTSAPRWLNAGRLSMGKIDEKKLAHQMSSIENAHTAIESGELDVDTLIGRVTNQKEAAVKKDQIPELTAFNSINPEDELKPYRITTANGDNFIVIDASQQIGFKEDAPSLGDYKVLTGKLLGRMLEGSEDGTPHILIPDNTMQKALRTVGPARVDELRMNGKNRMYISIVQSPEDQPDIAARIVILGTHGGDATTQRHFIDGVVPAH